MPPEESFDPVDWLADQDWRRVAMLLEHKDPRLAGFCLQQALEKYLKAYLLSQGWRLRRIHDLDALLDDATDHDSGLEEFRGLCEKISAYYMAERYPFVSGLQVTLEDVRESFGESSSLVERLREHLDG